MQNRHKQPERSSRYKSDRSLQKSFEDAGFEKESRKAEEELVNYHSSQDFKSRSIAQAKDSAEEKTFPKLGNYY